jgi:hypothetical protein
MQATSSTSSRREWAPVQHMHGVVQVRSRLLIRASTCCCGASPACRPARHGMVYSAPALSYRTTACCHNDTLQGRGYSDAGWAGGQPAVQGRLLW